MVQVQFPRESARMGAALPNASREEVFRFIEALSESVGVSAAAVFDGQLMERAMERLEELAQSEIALNSRISDLRKELSELSIAMNSLEPVEIASRLDLLQRSIFNCSEPSTSLLREDLSVLKDRFEHLRFEFLFPDTEELKRDSFQNNLLYRMEQKIAQSGPKAAAHLQESLASLQSQVKAAEEIFRGKGLSSYSALPKHVRSDIEGRVFERFPGSSIEALSSELNGRILAAAAVMASLGDRMIDVEL